MKTNYKKKKTAEGFISATPLPSDLELKNFYAETYYQSPKSSTYQKSYDSLEIDYKNLKCNALLHALKSLNSAKEKSFLDIGAGEGFLLNAADQKGFDVTGLDFSAYGISKFFPDLSVHHIAGDVFQSLSNLIDKGNQYDICTSTNVLEHVIDPALFLKLIKQLINENSLLAITVPNDYSDIQQLAIKNKMIDEEFWFVPPHHLHYFNTENLPTYMNDNGFEILDAFSDFPVDLYLLHSGSNYIKNKTSGYEANRARMHHDLMIANKHGLDRYLDFYRAMFKVGLGRDITIIVRLLGN
jgi:2-polyprenyl-3-methyl-5-hydroxy-6-metoxy-1,4-benzoquinol methylase